DSTDRIDPTPYADESFGVTSVNRNREERNRNNPKTDGRREPVKREKESGDSGRDRRYQKPFRPAVESLVRNHSKQNDKAGDDGDQANQRVNDRVDKEYHVVPSFTSLPEHLV